MCLCCGAAGQANTFTVTTADSVGPGSLFEAIMAANANAGADTIAFNIPGEGVQTISVGEHGLPEITDPVTIDGYTQPGAAANTLSTGDDACVLVRIDGTYMGDPPHHGLIISAGNSVIRGLALTGFPFILETLFTGTAIILKEKGGNFIEGNFIGLDPDELQSGANLIGVSISSSNNSVGGTLPAQRNVIANNLRDGIEVGSTGNVIQGNYLGTDPSGTIKMSNVVALVVDGSGTQIGGLQMEAANLISGNDIGIVLTSLGTENVVEGNLIGTDAWGIADLGNFDIGVSISGSQNLVGGLEPGAGNRIWFNPRGVRVWMDTDNPAMENSILSNSISAPGAKIDLSADGELEFGTRNDLGDGDTGPNELQNHPIITSTSFLQDRTTVRGGLNSMPATNFIIQFFTGGLRANESGFLDSETITTNAAGLAYFEFDFPPLPPDLIITATATDEAGNTSEYPADFGVQLANISARGQVGTNDDVLIAGFIVHQPPPDGPLDFRKKVLLRGLGHSLGELLPGRLANPTLELHDACGAVIAANDNWRTDQEAEIVATGAAPVLDAEAALIADLPDGSYTVQVRGADESTGVGVVEVYDLDPLPLHPFAQPPSGHLVNISARGLVGADDNLLIGGLIVRGDVGQSVLIRAIGPDLDVLHVPNPLLDPTLELRDGSGALLASNDNWRDEQEESISGSGLAPNDDRDAALVFALIPGSYTAIVRGAGDSAGVALVEIYDLNLDHQDQTGSR